MKILCTGDLHLGRRSSRLPAPVDGATVSAAAAWHAVVRAAVEARVDVVAISGDVVDKDNRYFEAFGPLEAGLRTLAEAGIETVAVAGNHDAFVLPALARSLGGGAARLLGAGGRWERHTIVRDGRPVLHVDGWSFPAEHVTESPIASYPGEPGGGVPVLAMVHGDLDAPASRYAPLSSAAMRALPADLWLIGHIHTPAYHERPGGAPILYPGSPQALDPGEPGAHGAWLVEMSPGGTVSARLLPLSTARYDVVDVDTEGVTDGEEMRTRAAEAVQAHLASVVSEGCGPLRHLSCRVRVRGRTALHRDAAALLAESRELEILLGDVTARVHGVEIATRPAYDLDDLARGSDAPAVLARLVRAIDAGAVDDGQQRLLDDLARRMGEVRRAPAYGLLADPPPTPGEARETARRQALALLDALLAQKEAA